MPFPVKPKQFKSWSNSRWNDYAECPLKAKFKHLDKLPEPKSEAMERGIYIAKQEEDYLLGKIKVVPPDIHKDLKPFFVAAKKAPNLMVEQNWGFDKNWNVVDYFDWNNCWLRVKVDMGWDADKGSTLFLADNKTGGADKRTGKLREDSKEKYIDQLELYTAAGIARFPHYKKIQTQLVYTDLGVTYPEHSPMTYTPAQAKAFQKAWTKRVAPMFNDTRFAPRPGYYCSYCHFSKKKGGPCRF